jgi:hypothetical protein
MKQVAQLCTKVLLILFTAVLSVALTVEYATLEELSLESNLIIYGKVKDSYSVWEDKNIYTYTSLDIINSVKGDYNAGQRITVKQLGGSVGDIGQEINGTPKLKKDSEVFLFLVDWKNNYWIHSIILGYYEVIDKEGTKYAVNNFNNVQLIDPATKRPIEDIDHIKTMYELNDLIADIEQALNKENGNE